MTQYEIPEKTPQAVSRLGLYLAPGLLCLLALCWSGFWVYASNKAGEAIDQWVTTEKAAGRNWDCVDKTVSGYPFRIELNCSSINFTAANLQVALGAFHAAAQVYSPKLALADLTGPLQIESAGTKTLLAWKSMRVSVRFDKDLERLSIMSSEFSAGDTANVPALTTKVAELHLRTDTGRPSEDRSVDFALRLDDMHASMLDAEIGNPDAGSVELNGTATQILGLRAGAWQSTLDVWRMQNGRLILEASRIAKGNFVVEGKGAVGLDPLHRIQGELSVGIRGAGPLISRFVPPNVTQIAAALLERKDGSAVQMPLRLQDGRISFGPLRSGSVLTPLY